MLVFDPQVSGVHTFILLYSSSLLTFSRDRLLRGVLNSTCWAALQSWFPGTSALVSEVVSWQLSQWVATVRCCSSPLLPFLCWCTEWIAATFTCGRLDSRCCGKPHGISCYSTRSITCRSLCASGTQRWRLVDDNKPDSTYMRAYVTWKIKLEYMWCKQTNTCMF